MPEAAAVIRAGDAARGALRTLSASAKVDAFTKERRVRVREVLVVDDRGRLRLETLSPFEQPLSTLVSDGKAFALYDLGKKEFFYGPATPENVSRLLPIRMRGDQIARLLMKIPTVIAHDQVSLKVDLCRTQYRLTYTNTAAHAEQLVVLDGERFVPVRTRLTLAGNVVYEVDFERHEPIAGHPLPRKIRYRAPRDKVDIVLLYGDDVAANETFEEDVFRLEPPRGAAVKRLEASCGH